MVHQEGYSPVFVFDGVWVAILVVESLCPFHLVFDVLPGTLGTKFGIPIYIGGRNKNFLVVCCQFVFLVSRFDWSVEVEYSSWRLRRKKKRTPQSSRFRG